MLPKKRRIDRKLFNEIIQNSSVFNSPSLTLFLSKSQNIKDQSKFSFSVSKKTEKSAVCRNKLRRRGYSIIQKNLDKIKSGYLFRFSFKKNYQKNFRLLEGEIMQLLSRS